MGKTGKYKDRTNTRTSRMMLRHVIQQVRIKMKEAINNQRQVLEESQSVRHKVTFFYVLAYNCFAQNIYNTKNVCPDFIYVLILSTSFISVVFTLNVVFDNGRIIAVLYFRIFS